MLEPMLVFLSLLPNKYRLKTGCLWVSQPGTVAAGFDLLRKLLVSRSQGWKDGAAFEARLSGEIIFTLKLVFTQVYFCAVHSAWIRWRFVYKRFSHKVITLIVLNAKLFLHILTLGNWLHLSQQSGCYSHGECGWISTKNGIQSPVEKFAIVEIKEEREVAIVFRE